MFVINYMLQFYMYAVGADTIKVANPEGIEGTSDCFFNIHMNV